MFEDGVEQKIAYFWVDSRPISVGFVIDGSSNMNDLMNEAIRGAGPAFLKSKDPDDEYFVIVFSNSATMVVSYTTDAKLMPHVYPMTGEDPLYDAIYVGIDAMKEAANPRRLLLVMTTGGDNGKGQNRRSTRQLRHQTTRADLFHAVGLDSQQGLIDSNVLDCLPASLAAVRPLSTDSAFAGGIAVQGTCTGNEDAVSDWIQIHQHRQRRPAPWSEGQSQFISRLAQTHGVDKVRLLRSKEPRLKTTAVSGK